MFIVIYYKLTNLVVEQKLLGAAVQGVQSL